MTVRSKAYVCGRSIAGNAGSNPIEVIDVSSIEFVVCYVGSGLCDGLNTNSEGSYRVCVCVCVCVSNCA